MPRANPEKLQYNVRVGGEPIEGCDGGETFGSGSKGHHLSTVVTWVDDRVNSDSESKKCICLVFLALVDVDSFRHPLHLFKPCWRSAMARLPALSEPSIAIISNGHEGRRSRHSGLWSHLRQPTPPSGAPSPTPTGIPLPWGPPNPYDL